MRPIRSCLRPARRVTTAATLTALVAVVVVLAAGCSTGDVAERTSGPRGSAASGAGATACAGLQESAAPAKALTRCLMPSIAFVETSTATGSGMVVRAADRTWILTNLHVVDPEPTATVVLPGDSPVVMKRVPVAGVDKLTDIALLGPVTTSRRPVRLEDPGLEKGDPVWLLGYPGETEEEPDPTITSGIVSRIRREPTYDLDFIQTDATITGGQSGGALADARGNVVGVSGLGFADEFALALGAEDVRHAMDRILGDHPDGYLTFPPAEGVQPVTSGTALIVDSTDTSSLFVAAGTTALELTVTSDGAPPTISVDDFDSGENIFMDRAGLAAYFGLDDEPTPEDIATMVDDLDLQVGDPVAPGRWQVTIPADAAAVISLGVVDDVASTVSWTATPGVFVPPSDVVDRPLTLGEPVTDTLDLLEESATWTIDLQAGTTYRVVVHSNVGDPEVSIVGPGQSEASAWVAEDHGGIYGLDVDEEFEPDVSGSHRIRVENWGGAALVYRLEITRA